MKHGFTLIELLIVFSILIIIFALGMPLTINYYQSYQLISERDNMVGLLRRVRTFSLANRNSLPHGLHLGSDAYTLFTGESFMNRDPAFDEIFPKSGAATVGGPAEIVFSPLSATTTGGTLMLNVGPQSASVLINATGGISW